MTTPTEAKAIEADTVETLKPCPFCGSVGALSETEGCDFVICCTNQKCGLVLCDDMDWGIDDYDGRANVIRKWNTRQSLTPSPTAEDVKGALKAQVICDTLEAMQFGSDDHKHDAYAFLKRHGQYIYEHFSAAYTLKKPVSEIDADEFLLEHINLIRADYELPSIDKTTHATLREALSGARSAIIALQATLANEEGWREIATCPRNGQPFYARFQTPMRWMPYKQDAKRQGYPEGRWQEMTDYGGWKNTEFEPMEWKPHESDKPIPSAPKKG